MTDSISCKASEENLLLLAKKTLKASGGFELWMSMLSQRLHLISTSPDTVIQNVLVENWADEVIKFIILKTEMEDFTEPCQLTPGYAISVGWSALVLLPNHYELVCQTIGSEGKFDHNLTDYSKEDVLRRRLRIQRHNATLREYEKYFDSKPPMLYWSFEPPQGKKTTAASDDLTSIFEMFCCGTLESAPSYEQPKAKASMLF
jgi:hypothetical protein